MSGDVMSILTEDSGLITLDSGPHAARSPEVTILPSHRPCKTVFVHGLYDFQRGGMAIHQLIISDLAIVMNSPAFHRITPIAAGHRGRAVNDLAAVNPEPVQRQPGSVHIMAFSYANSTGRIFQTVEFDRPCFVPDNTKASVMTA